MSTATVATPSVATFGAAARSVLRIAGPLIAHGLVTVAVTMNDTVLLGRSGAPALGAAAAASAVVMVGVLLLAGLVGTPTQILAARAIGAADPLAAARAAERSVPIAVATSLVIVIGVFAWAGPLVQAIGGTAIDPVLSAAMLRVMIFGVLITGMTNIARGYATGLGLTRVVVASALVSAAVDIAVSLTLLQLIGPIGVTIGTVCSYAAAFATFVMWLRGRRRVDEEAPRMLRATLAFPGTQQREPFALGWSEGLLGATSAGAGVVVTLLLSTSRPEVLAASRSLESMTLLLWVVLMGISSAGLTLLGQARGADDRTNYHRALAATLTVSGGTSLALALTLPWITVPVLTLAVGESIAVEASQVVWLAWLVAPWITLSTVALAVCRSFRDTRTPMWASIASEYIVFLPVGWLLCRVWEQGIVGLYLAHHIYYAAFIGIACTVAIMHLLRPWRIRSRFEEPAPETTVNATPLAEESTA